MDRGTPPKPSSPPRVQVKKENEEEIKVSFINVLNTFMTMTLNFRSKTIMRLWFRIIGKRPVTAHLVIGEDGIVFLNLILFRVEGNLHKGSLLRSWGYAE